MSTAAIIGGPGCGKTFLANSLERRGYPVIHEIARRMIHQGVYHPLKDHLNFQWHALQEQRKCEERFAGLPDWFTDGGEATCIGYRRVYGLPLDDFHHTLQPRRYGVVVLCAPVPDWALCKEDGVRYETDREFPYEVNAEHLRAYEDLGHTVIKLPFIEGEGRTDALLDALNLDRYRLPLRDTIVF